MAKDADAYKTGNRKCWHVVNMRGSDIAMDRLTLSQAKTVASNFRDATYCRDGYKLIPCAGAAHGNPYIDNCSICAPRWGVVMVPATEQSNDD